ncbi:MAG: ABC transporter substrate-binding protein [Caldilineaceae bacterium]|nr:ABC transporter substrate-binding protein [Caldilineaceae bacterium]MCB9119781.1 ABC transporter substrate-binding protein [Caldilineaceae bacterium]HRW46574.1 ABC transporter substrate-binding protein [Caldilinea sp.]
MKTRWSILTLFLIAAMVVAACAAPAAAPAPAQDAAPAEATEPAAAEAAAPSGDAITLEFWHAMGGNLGEVVQELVDRFNASQDGIVVNATYQGSYDDTYNALLASFESGGTPNIVQNFDLASQTMIDTGKLVPAWQLMEADGYDPSVFIPAVRDYYSDENGMVALAFNSSTPLLYYNADMFEAAGVAAPEGSLSFSDFLALCDQLKAAEVAPYCFTFGQVGWEFEQYLANSGGLYFNENNGRTARPTEVLFNNDKGVEVFDFLTKLVIDGYAPNLNNTWTETDSTFLTQQAAIQFDSTSDVSLIQNAEFNVGTAFIPHADSSERNGVVLGGAALWLIDSGDAALNDAAWEFMKFMAAPEQQKTWHMSTGYFPVRSDLMEDPELQQFWAENPNFATAIEQLTTTNTTLADGTPNYAVLGGRAGPFPAIRRIIVETYSRVLNDGLSAQDALNEAAEKANAELENYNAFFQ